MFLSFMHLCCRARAGESTINNNAIDIVSTTAPQPCTKNKQHADPHAACSLRDACRIQTCDLLIRSQMLYSAELRRQNPTGEPVLCYSAEAVSFVRLRFASLMRAFLPARLRR